MLYNNPFSFLLTSILNINKVLILKFNTNPMLLQKYNKTIKTPFTLYYYLYLANLLFKKKCNLLLEIESL